MRTEGNRGIVLVAVLFAVAIMSVLVVAVTLLARSGIASTNLDERRLATQLALRSGLEAGKAVIVSTEASQRTRFDATPVTLGLGGGLSAEVRIRDAAGLADLNRSELPLLEAILRDSLGATEAGKIAADIASWRTNAAEKTKPPAPADVAKPEGEKPDTPPAPVVFVSLEQLLAMADPDEAAALAGRLTVFSPTGRVNPLAAPDEVLKAVPGLAASDLSAVAAARKMPAPGAVQSLALLAERLKEFLTLQDPTVFLIEVRLLEGPGVIARSSASTVVQLAAQGPLAFRTLWVSSP
jgi:general secretion pathway protein K